MTELSRELRELIEAGPMAHLTTINEDGSPQVTVIWIGLDGAEIVSGHMRRRRGSRGAQPQLKFRSTTDRLSTLRTATAAR